MLPFSLCKYINTYIHTCYTLIKGFGRSDSDGMFIELLYNYGTEDSIYMGEGFQKVLHIHITKSKVKSAY